MGDSISRQLVIDELCNMPGHHDDVGYSMIYRSDAIDRINSLAPSESDIIQCKDCKYWRQQTNYVGAPLSFGFCESNDMLQSLYGDISEVSHIDTDEDFYCGYAKRIGEE